MDLEIACLSVGMLVTGALNTLTTKYQDQVVVGHGWHGAPITYYHPAVQSTCMFLGEFLCLLPYLVQRWHHRNRKEGTNPTREPPQSHQFQAHHAPLNVHTHQHSYPQSLREPLLQPLPHIRTSVQDNGVNLSDIGHTTFVLALPTLCDAASTMLMYMGLYYTSASIYQMLRGIVVFFAGVLTIIILKRQLHLHHWQGMMLIVVGAFVVGLSSIVDPSCSPSDNPHYPPGPDYPDYPPDNDTSPVPSPPSPLDAFGSLDSHTSSPLPSCSQSTHPMLGNLLVMAAQLFSALQFVIEEKYVKQYRVPALLAVGLEGFWGIILSCGLLPLFQNIRGPEGWPVDDAKQGLADILSHPKLQIAVLLSILSIAFFNYFGVSVTKRLSSTTRLSIDACRTVIVWAVSLVFGWEHFVGVQLLGFLILICGSILYNELLAIAMPDSNASTPQQPSPYNSLSLRGGYNSRSRRGYPARTRASDSQYDFAPSLRIGGGMLSPHSLGSMGGRDCLASAPATDLWGSPSLDSRHVLTPAANQQPQAGSVARSASAIACSSGPVGGGGVSAGTRALARNQPSQNNRVMSGGSLYNAFYSGLDVATPPASASGSKTPRPLDLVVAHSPLPDIYLTAPPPQRRHTIECLTDAGLQTAGFEPRVQDSPEHYMALTQPRPTGRAPDTVAAPGRGMLAAVLEQQRAGEARSRFLVDDVTRRHKHSGGGIAVAPGLGESGVRSARGSMTERPLSEAGGLSESGAEVGVVRIAMSRPSSDVDMFEVSGGLSTDGQMSGLSNRLAEL